MSVVATLLPSGLRLFFFFENNSLSFESRCATCPPPQLRSSPNGAPLSAFLTPFDGANLRDMKGRRCVSGSRRGCLSEWLRARVQLAPAPTLRKGSTVFTSRCVGSLRQGLSHSLTVCNFPFFLLSSRLTSPASLICYTSAPALFLFAPPPFCSPWCKVVILISLSPADHSPLYLSNYLSALSPPSHPAIHPICLYVKYLHLL